MAVTFYNVNTRVNNTGLLSESASIEINTSLAPTNFLGGLGIIDQTPGNFRANLTLNYQSKLDQEPNYQVASGLRSYLGDCPVVVHIAGLTAYPCYLERYSIRAEPNSLIKSTASYVCFTPLLGSLQNKLINLNFSGNNPSGVSHSWSTPAQSDNILGFNYDFSQKWEAQYALGSPSNVNVLNFGGQETLSLTKDTYTQPTFSGIDASDFMNPPSIQVNSLNIFCGQDGNSINLDMSNAKITSSSLNAATKDIVRTTTTLVKYH